MQKTPSRLVAACVIAVLGTALTTAREPAGPIVAAEGTDQGPQFPTTPIDPYTSTPRLVVLTDIANEPDDQMSMVRLLVYSNQFDIEGLVATTSTWMKNAVRPDVIRLLL